MSTRGVLGFRVDGIDRITYNQSDSYPGGLGKDTCEWLRGRLLAGGGSIDDAVDRLKVQVRALVRVKEEVEPTPQDRANYWQYFENVSTGKDWYSLLRKLQGDPEKILAAGIYIDSADFVSDSLFCEWGYIVNLDTREMEVYQGFQEQEHDKGRYAALAPILPEGVYWPIALVLAIPFSVIAGNEAALNTILQGIEDEHS